MNNVISPKYGLAPEKIEERSLVQMMENIFKKFMILLG